MGSVLFMLALAWTRLLCSRAVPQRWSAVMRASSPVTRRASPSSGARSCWVAS